MVVVPDSPRGKPSLAGFHGGGGGQSYNKRGGFICDVVGVATP